MQEDKGRRSTKTPPAGPTLDTANTRIRTHEHWTVILYVCRYINRQADDQVRTRNFVGPKPIKRRKLSRHFLIECPTCKVYSCHLAL